ncbi:MAG: hypothetical protein HYR88_02280 [Verrucomicrobia bacterium]|nr:hypothetical protein [Verrucomicrobiota bacterium]MBI3870952.1 hypothetical protein [Verrucomicrobiota bacterium]
MRSRALFIGFVVLNAAFAAALVYFVMRSGSSPSTPSIPGTLTAFQTSPPPPTVTAPPSTQPRSNPVPTLPPTNGVAQNPAGTETRPPATPLAAGKQFGWKDVESSNYLSYLKNIREVGCPEKMVRQIIFNDGNDLFNQRRLEAAITHDFKWWQPDTQYSAGGYNPEYQSRMQTLVLDRRELLTRLLGENWEQEDKAPSIATHTVALTGPVLGALPLDIYMGVQEICTRSMSRHQDYMMGRFNEGLPTSQVELARLRDQTRKELSVILDRDQLEEFLLRFSHNASKLRQDLRGLGISSDEFRLIFRATDQIDHQIQLEYGGEEALSPKQREQMTRQREQAVQNVLGKDRYSRLILSRDPLYRQAQMMVMQSGADDALTPELYEILRSAQARRQQVQGDRQMSAEEKQNALIAINQEQLQKQRKLLQRGN